MKSERFRDYAISVAAVVFAISTIYSLYQMYTSFNQYPQFPQSELTAYATCEPNPLGGISATVTLQNVGGKELKNVTCVITDDGGLFTSSKTQELGSLPPQSSDSCYFILEGNHTRPVKFEISYDSSSMKTVC
jgi:hypothetical protein